MKTLKIALVALLAAFTVSCGGNANDPGQVAKKFSSALMTANFEEAKKYCTEESVPMLTMMAGYIDEEGIEKMRASNPKIEVIETEIDEEKGKAIVTMKVSGAYDFEEKEIMEDETEAEVDLYLIDGKWLVVETK